MPLRQWSGWLFGEIPLNQILIGKLLGQAVDLHQQGCLPQAAQLYARVIDLEPAQPDALHLLGVLRNQSGDSERGAALIKLSLQANPAQPFVWASLGNIQLADGQFEAALASFDRSIELEPSYAPAHNGRGSALFALAREHESLQSFERALTLLPQFPEALENKALALLASQRYPAAAAAFTAALALAPGSVRLLAKRALALCAMQRYDEALADCDLAQRLGADTVEVLFLRASALLALGRSSDVIVALSEGHATSNSNPDLAVVHGNALRQLGRLTEAVSCFERALAERADHPEALLGLGTVEAAAGHFDRAAVMFSRLFDAAPNGDFHRGLCMHARLQIFDWQDHAGQVALLVTSVRQGDKADLPLTFLSISDDPELQQRCAQAYVCAFRRDYAPLYVDLSARADDGRIRVVYLSGDFLEHPVAYLMAGVFETHDRSRFEIIAVSLRRDPSSPTACRLERAFDRFIDASMHSDEQIAGLIAGTGADIVVDLMGYTSAERPGILLRRPAPIQVNYLGIPATMGSNHIDYILADEFVIPPRAAPFYSEAIAYLPQCFQANDARRVEPGADLTRTQLGLPETGFVWACFCASAKINPTLFEVWMRMLKQLPGSVLWTIAGSAAAGSNIRREAAARGVDPNRLVLAGRESYSSHLGRLKLADLCLDTWPFNGGATTSDALWSGVPVVTLAGEAFASRMSGSLLRAVGLPELVTDTLVDYERVALDLATNQRALGRARERLQHARTAHGPFDTVTLTRQIEAAFTIMVEQRKASAGATTFRVDPT